MKISTAIASCLLVGSLGVQAQVPRVLGVWELNLGASTLPAQFPAVSETRSYTVRDDGYLVVLADVVAFTSDGNEVPFVLVFDRKAD